MAIVRTPIVLGFVGCVSDASLKDRDCSSSNWTSSVGSVRFIDAVISAEAEGMLKVEDDDGGGGEDFSGYEDNDDDDDENDDEDADDNDENELLFFSKTFDNDDTCMDEKVSLSVGI